MGIWHSLRVVAEMARITGPTMVDAARGHLARADVDARAAQFARRVVEVLAVDLRVTGGDEVDPTATYVYMSNHQSHLDIPMLYAALPGRTIRMVGKTELFQIPLWGRGLRAAEFIEVDRSDRTRAVASMKRAGDLIRDGVSVYLAPEGTRSRDGRVGPLKKGGFHLATSTGVPIVPIAIRGTIEILPRGGRSARPGCTVDVHIGAPITVGNRSIPDLMVEVAAFLRKHVEGDA
jgi:1-acyl-sn-glycerol-3-phosphate acyltransferase